MGDNQLNKIQGRAIMALHKTGHSDWLPAIEATGGTPNQKLQRVAILLRAYPPPHPNAARALERCLDALRLQERAGHMCLGANEFMTPSHAPIHLIAMASILTTALERLLTHPGPLFPAARGWWSNHLWMCSRLYVPRGPLAGQVAGLGARYGIATDKTRDVCFALYEKRTPDVGPHYWQRAENEQDDYASVLVRDLVHRGAFDGLTTKQPKVATPYTIVRCADGHVTLADFGPKDPKAVSVRYSDGRITESDDRAELGAALSTTVLT